MMIALLLIVIFMQLLLLGEVSAARRELRRNAAKLDTLKWVRP